MAATGRHAGARVALDAMGGDFAPDATVAGALRAHAAGVDVVLVGRPRDLLAALAVAGARNALPIVAADDVVRMDEDPAIALRGKPRASIRVAAELVAEGRARALVSAGSTGATLAAALLTLGRVPGARRPVVAAVVPTQTGGVVVVDAGGSADVQPEALPAYARMASAYAAVRGVERPRVGLLNVGAEPGKGNALAKAAFGLLAADDGFVGNVEPAAVLAGAVDVVVTDGFTGNVFLKTVEAVAGPVATRAHGGAAVLLGVAGEVLVAHGAAGPDEVAAALHTAAEVASARLSVRIAQRLAASGRSATNYVPDSSETVVDVRSRRDDATRGDASGDD